jgi:hypothetical protein
VRQASCPCPVLRHGGRRLASVPAAGCRRKQATGDQICRAGGVNTVSPSDRNCHFGYNWPVL